MSDNLPTPIFNDNDLTVYENFINSINLKDNKNNDFSQFLTSNLNKIIKVYVVVGNNLTTRQGRLLNVGKDYIVLSQTREKLIVKLTDIKFLSVM